MKKQLIASIRANRFLLVTRFETILLGAYFITNAFQFARPDLLNTLASHIDDPPFAVGLIIIGTFMALVALFDLAPLTKWCYGIGECVWFIYTLSFWLQDYEIHGHVNLLTYLMLVVTIRIALEAWAGGEPDGVD
ncbi:hypothetical protein [Levilactobacillus bambusae]|uniref:Uncharacterized protein n=1 Tax=Levilactobacillus bambusae TaxID=2024736 RepID=A0A2V1N527_9LACO|nr:hypothetical protein [Levilactobacillus bambusae]PWG00945.1 hypothetical protein DCM90_01855 [Levilactobacillus bambusae]